MKFNIPLRSSIGFIGLGQMGFPMASNLLKAMPKHPFYILDHSLETTKKFVEANPTAVIATSPLEIAQKCDAIFTMLPASAHVRSVYLGKDGLFEGLKKGAVVIDSSTIDPSTSQEIARLLTKKSVDFMDAPVSGGTPGAKNATLTFMVGAANPKAFDRSKQYLNHMGKNIIFCGGSGNGQIAKICNNMLLGITMIAAAETMNLGSRMGMDPKLLASIINTSTGRCWSTDTYNPCPGVMESPASRGYTGGFGVSLMAKDMGLAVSAANETKSTSVLASVSHQIYNQVMGTKGFEDKDFSSVFGWLNDNAVKFQKK